MGPPEHRGVLQWCNNRRLSALEPAARLDGLSHRRLNAVQIALMATTRAGGAAAFAGFVAELNK